MTRRHRIIHVIAILRFHRFLEFLSRLSLRVLIRLMLHSLLMRLLVGVVIFDSFSLHLTAALVLHVLSVRVSAGEGSQAFLPRFITFASNRSLVSLKSLLTRSLEGDCI